MGGEAREGVPGAGKLEFGVGRSSWEPDRCRRINRRHIDGGRTQADRSVSSLSAPKLSACGTVLV
jgi:hypothetical protein